MELDYSYMSLRVYVEKMTRRQSLIDYQFGQEETIAVHGVFKLRYNVTGIYYLTNLNRQKKKEIK